MTPERSPERDAALEAALPFVGALGWTRDALRQAAGPDADLLFPGGPAEMVEAWCDLADRRMAEDAAGLDMDGMRLADRVRWVIAGRLARAEPHREAVRRAVGLLAMPGHAVLAARCTARTVDAIWRAAGDDAAGWSRHSKRAILAGIYCSTVLFWLRDGSEGAAATLAFLDRRLADVGRLGRLRRAVPGMLRRG